MDLNPRLLPIAPEIRNAPRTAFPEREMLADEQLLNADRAVQDVVYECRRRERSERLIEFQEHDLIDAERAEQRKLVIQARQKPDRRAGMQNRDGMRIER